MSKKTVILDGEKIHSLATFYDEIENKLTKNLTWNIGRNYNTFTDILEGGFGIYDYEEPITLIWKNSRRSQTALGWEETIKYLIIKLETYHPANRNFVDTDLQLATHHKGKILFQLIVDEISSHSHIDLRLE